MKNIKKIAVTLPGGFSVSNPPGFKSGELNSLGDLFSGVANIVIYIAGFLMLFWFAWGVFQYIFAGGDKAALEKARSRITWAIVGFFITMLAFAISQFASQIFPQTLPSQVQKVSVPSSSP